MFQKKATADNPRRPTEPTTSTETVIGRAVLVEGNLSSRSGVELLGTVEGNVEVAGPLVVRESGRVIGDVTAHDVIVDGAVQGQVKATGRIELGATGRIEGDLRGRAVAIADGAYFVGKVEMSMDSETRKSNRVPAVQPAVV